MIPYKQLSLADIFQDCQEKFENDKPAFLSLLEQHIDMDEIIPLSFRNHFYASTGRTRKYPLQALLWALIIQRIFSIPTDELLLVFLAYSKPLREFCGFSKVPDGSKITRSKQDFLEDLQVVFDNLVDRTEPICQAINSEKADMTIFDSSGIEAFVTENNPKYANRIIKQLKAMQKPKVLMNPTTHTKLLMVPCLPMPVQMLKLNNSTSMDIFVMPINSALLPMDLASFVILLSIIGSFNMNMRSAYLDTEIMAVIHSEAVTEQLNQYMSSYEAQSVRIMENGQVEIPIGMERQKISQKKKRKITFLKICNWLRFLM